jgi:magnesium chelatase subunit D
VIEAIVETATALGIDSARSAHQAVQSARIAAALAGQDEAGADAAAQAVQAVLAPRATRYPEVGPSDAEPPASSDEPASTDAAPPETPTSDPSSPEAPSSGTDEVEPADGQRKEPEAQLAERLVGAARATLPADLLSLLGSGTPRRPAGASGRMGSATRSFTRGRSIGVRRGEPRDGARLALVETLRCAAPWQRVRREAAGAHDTPPSGVIVHRSDLRVQRREQRRTTTTIFAIDASGSQAMSRLAEAKGAVELLLADCYARRDSVGVIAFRGTRATLLLAPTRSLVRARRELAGLPGGGGTPLASGLEAARALAETSVRAGSTPLVVLLTDGRANITLRGEPGRAVAAADALAAARALAAGGFAALLIDTADHPSQNARTLAEAMRARYVPLPHAGARAVSAAVRRERDAVGPVLRRD